MLDDNILEKPSNAEHAKSMLSSLSGARHSVITAVVLCFSTAESEPRIVQFYEETFVQFSQLTDAMIEAYVATGTPMYVSFVFTHVPRPLSCYSSNILFILGLTCFNIRRDKAGGYGIQEVIGGSFVERIEGDYYNVTGFPLNRFCKELIPHFTL